MPERDELWKELVCLQTKIKKNKEISEIQSFKFKKKKKNLALIAKDKIEKRL